MERQGRPYRWLKTNQTPPESQPKPINPRKYPAYVTLIVQQHIPFWNIPMLMASMGMVMLGLAIGIVSLIRVINMTVTDKKR